MPSRGDVDLFAPRGTLNVGDAGIRLSGNLNIAALLVLNGERLMAPVAALDVHGADAALSGQRTALTPITLQHDLTDLSSAAPTTYSHIQGVPDGS